MSVSRCTTEEVLELTRYFERWRFKRVEPEFDERVRRRQVPWEPIKLPDTAFLRWAEAVAPRLKLQDSVRLRWERQWDWVPIVGAVPVLPPQVTDASRWTSLVRGAWRFTEAIHVKESRVEVLSIRRAARTVAWHGTMVLTLCHNLSCALAHEKRRAKDY